MYRKLKRKYRIKLDNENAIENDDGADDDADGGSDDNNDCWIVFKAIYANMYLNVHKKATIRSMFVFQVTIEKFQ